MSKRRHAFRLDRLSPRHQTEVAAQAGSSVNMNRTEARYAELLEDFKRCGVIRAYEYEPEKLLLADRTTYLPDFKVWPESLNEAPEYHEVKGPYHWEDARVKFKLASKITSGHVFFWVKWENKRKLWRFEKWLAGKKLVTGVLEKA